MRRFFVHSEYGTELYFTEDEARAAAAEAIAQIRDECDEEWTDDVHSVFWGEVREEARQVRVEADGESFVDYVLKAV